MHRTRIQRKITRRHLLQMGAATLLSTSLCSPLQQHLFAYTNNAVILWNQALLQAILDNHFGPSIAARAIAMTHTAIYDAWSVYDPVAIGVYLDKKYRRPLAEGTSLAKQQAISYAAYRTLLDLFPASTSLFESMMTQFGYDYTDLSLDPHTPTGLGNLAARFLLNARHYDGSNQLGDLHAGAYSDYTNYVSTNTPDLLADPTRWQPLRVSNGHGGSIVQTFTTPQWGRVQPFALKSGAQFRISNHLPDVTSPEYFAQAQQILDFSAHLTDTQKTIAEYWRDSAGTVQPCGHWMLFAEYVSQRDNHTLDQDVQLFFPLANALFDASIACWDCKRAYDSVRPVSAIHYLFAGKKVRAWAGPHLGTRLIDGKDWMPYQPITVVTPPFPEFYSGHSTFSAAAAEIFRRSTGSDAFGASFTRPAGSSPLEPKNSPATDITLLWPTFSAAAKEAGLSRLYGGIHFSSGNLTGQDIGHFVAQVVWEKAHAHITGKL